MVKIGPDLGRETAEWIGLPAAGPESRSMGPAQRVPRCYCRMKRRRATDSSSLCSGLLLPPGRHVCTSLLR